MMMNKWIVAMIVFSAGVFALAEPVNFTAAEGYSAGELTLNAGWSGSAGAGFLVDPSGDGVVTNVGAVAWRNLQYNEGAQSADADRYAVSASFTVEGTDSTSQTVDKALFSVTFVDVNNNKRASLMLRRIVGGAFDVGFIEDTGSVNASLSGADASSAELGLGSALGVSDQLRLTMNITRGADETDWTYSGRLENIDTSVVLSSVNGTFESSDAFFTNAVFAGLSSRSAMAEANLSPVTVQEFNVLAIDLQTVSFASAEGYSNGELILNSGWSGSGGAGFLVNPFGSGAVTNVGAAAWKNMQYNAGAQSVSGTTYTVSSTFSFAGTDSTSQTVDKSVLKTTFVDGTAKLEALFRRLKNGGFDVGFYENSGSVNGSGNGVDVLAADVGLGATLSESDQLRVLMTITRGADETDWSYSVRLENLDTATTLSTVSGTFESSVSFFTSDVVAGFSSASAVSEAELSPFTIQEFTVCTVDSDAVGFTSAEGYSSGDLILNSGWSGSAGFSVDSFSGAITNIGSAVWKNVSYDAGAQPVAGSNYTVSARFAFEGTESSFQAAVRTLYSVNFMDGASKIQLLFRRRAGGDFDAAFFENSGSVNASQNGGGAASSLLGLGSTLSVSDELLLTLSITRGTDETDWSYSGSLRNLDTDSTLSSVDGTFESSVSFFTNDVIAGLSSAFAASDADISPLTISEFDVGYDPIVQEVPVVPVTSIEMMEWVAADLLKLTICSNDELENLKLVGTSDLINGSWADVAHSDNGSNAFVLTNLSYATSVDSTNCAIYIQTTNSAAFFGIE